MTLSPLRLRLLVGSLLVVSFLGALDHTIVSTSIATIGGGLGALEQMSWIMVGYTLAATVMLPVLGKLGDVVGPRRVFLVSLLLFIVSSAVCGFAPSIEWLVGARIAQGLSSAGLQLMSQTIIARVTSPRERPRFMAIVGSAFPVAIVVGPLLGGLITDYLSWQWVFWVNVPVGLIALVIAMTAVPALPGGARPRFDIPGAVVFTFSLVALVLAVTWYGDATLRSVSLVCLVLAVCGLAALFLIERRAAAPLFPLPLLRDRTIAACLGLSAIIGAGLFAMTSYLPTYFQMAFRTSATLSGVVPIATVLGMLVGNLFTGYLVARTGRYRVYPIIGTILGASGMLGMAALPLGVPLWAPAALMCVVGLGTGAFMNLIVAVVQSAAPQDQLGSVTAMSNLVRQVGSTLGTAAIGGVIGFGVAMLLPSSLDPSTLTPQLVHTAADAVQDTVAVIYHDLYAPIFAALAAVYALGIIAAVRLPAGRLSDELPPVAPASSVPTDVTSASTSAI